jgi:hypothetical protein
MTRNRSPARIFDDFVAEAELNLQRPAGFNLKNKLFEIFLTEILHKMIGYPPQSLVSNENTIFPK